VFVGSNIIRHKDGSVSHEMEGNYTISGVILSLHLVDIRK